jgi:hypothetical protein
MTEREQIQAFANDVDKPIQRFRIEFQISNAGAIGVLIFAAHNIMQDARDSRNEEE